ncbi:NAD-dependent epimerase/dehydratase family protein [Balneolaceae bacterium YR4-1]|uniref:NAD-dependent epimerase/dehydratase family protein n=1 Tax=Halalkalibaculum roseum TaxID=2709311 RepID=A0A6M1SZC6_9BACT|nr:NAD-dependent epimerase/dehydratase family protein [Halalkalibaculum roseum]
MAIYKFPRLINKGEQITLFGYCSSRRDYTYIDDIIDGALATNEYDENIYEIINLGKNRAVQLLKLVETIQEALGLEANKNHAPEVSGNVEQTWADISKAKEFLGYSPNCDLEKGLDVFVEWYLKSVNLVLLVAFHLLNYTFLCS